MSPVSLAPKDFGTGRWTGGRATTSDAHFEYGSANFGRGDERVVNFILNYTTEEGQVYPGRFRVGTVAVNGTPILAIRETADDGADEAEVGLGISHADPSKTYHISPNSEFGIFLANAVAAGVSESQLESGDVSVFDGLDVDVAPKAKKEGDRFPLLVFSKVHTKSQAASKTAVNKKTASKVAGKLIGDAQVRAMEIVSNVLSEAGNGQTVDVSDVVRRAVQDLKGDPLKAQVVKLLGDSEFLSSGNWVYDAEDKTLMNAG